MHHPSAFRLVAMGGGTGLSMLLHGLKHHVVPNVYAASGGPEGDFPFPSHKILELTAVVTVSDDGGSSGRLRRELRVLPPGDIRNCLVALSEDEALMSRLFRFRFQQGRSLKGHSFGNLFLAALSGITGDFTEAVRLSSGVLAIRGRIFPCTPASVVLEADLADGRRIIGESRITKARGVIRKMRMLPADSQPLPETLAAIESADIITLGPGSLYTSLIPNLLVRGIPEAIAASPATKVFISNLMTQPGETTGYTASQHLAAIRAHCGRRLFDYVIVNDGAFSAPTLRRYRRHGAGPVVADCARIEAMGMQVLRADLVDEEEVRVRHKAAALADFILDLGAARRARASA